MLWYHGATAEGFPPACSIFLIPEVGPAFLTRPFGNPLFIGGLGIDFSGLIKANVSLLCLIDFYEVNSSSVSEYSL
jgi:hypothetical protein